MLPIIWKKCEKSDMPFLKLKKDHLSEVTFGSIENLTLPEDSSYPEIFINLAFNFSNSLFKTSNLYLSEVNISLKIISLLSLKIVGTYINFRGLKEEKI